MSEEEMRQLELEALKRLQKLIDNIDESVDFSDWDELGSPFGYCSMFD